MKENKNYEAELNLKDLLFHILYTWRIILLVGLAVAVFFGYKENKKDLTAATTQYEAEVAANQDAIARTEKDIAAYEELIQDLSNYRDTSILMKIDPMNIWTAEKKYYLNLEGSETDHSEKIMTVLAEAFSVNIDADTLVEAFGTTARNDINEVASISVNRNLWTISVIGCGNNEKEAVKRKEFVDSYLHETEQKLKKSLVFNLDVLSDNIATKTVLTNRNEKGDYVEKDLAEVQYKISEDIRAYQDEQNTYINNRNSLLQRGISKPEKNIMRQAIFGFALGAFLVIIISAAFYLFNGKLKTSRELRNRYDLSLLGEIDHSRAWWKGRGLDWVIERLEFGKKKIDLATELTAVVSLIDGKKNWNNIILLSTLEEGKLKKVYEGLAPALEEKGIILTMQSDYLHNSEAIAAVGDADTVLLVEEKYKSKVRDLNRIAELMTIESANVIGAMLL